MEHPLEWSEDYVVLLANEQTQRCWRLRKEIIKWNESDERKQKGRKA